MTFSFKDLTVYDDLNNLFPSIYTELKQRTGLNNIDLVKNFIWILLCKIYDETYNKDNLKFINKDNITNTAKNIRDLFKQTGIRESLMLDDNTIFYLVSTLEHFALTLSSANTISSAFETIIADSLKGEHGQYFTPQEVVKFILSFISVADSFKILDPACGTGVFLVNSWIKNQKNKNKINIYGFDNNDVVSYLAKCYLSILGNKNANIYTLNSLDNTEISNKLGTHILHNYFDIILTNPPYGNNIKVEDHKILQDFKLAKKNNTIIATNPEILFIEQCYNFLKENGTVALVLPEGIFGNPSLKYVREFITKNFLITHIIDLPTTTFAPNTGIKTSVLILKKQTNWQKEQSKINDTQSGVNNTGNDIVNDTLNTPVHIFSIHHISKDKQGKQTSNSDLAALKDDYNKGIFSSQYQTITYKQIIDDSNLTFYANYWLRLKQDNTQNSTEFYYKSINDLIKENVLAHTKNNKILTGNNPPSKFYFDGLQLENKDDFIRFVRTSDLNNFIINTNTQYYLDKSYLNKQDIQVNDILLVKDGYNKIGSLALVNDVNIFVQSHLFILRVLDNTYGLDNFNLAYLLAKDDYVKTQIKNSIFTQGTIPTINTNFYNIKIRILKDQAKLKQMGEKFKTFNDKLNDLYKEFNKKEEN